MSISIDQDVETAALLLQRNFPAAKLSSIVESLSMLAPALWGRHGREQVAPMSLVPAISPVETAPIASTQ